MYTWLYIRLEREREREREGGREGGRNAGKPKAEPKKCRSMISAFLGAAERVNRVCHGPILNWGPWQRAELREELG